MADEQAFGSFLPDDMTEGAFLDDVWARISKPRIEMYDFEGKADPKCCVFFDVTNIDEEDIEYRPQVYSIGGAENWEPSPDRNYAVPIGRSTKISKRSAFGNFMTHLVNEANFPIELITPQDIGFLDGLIALFKQYPVEGKTKKDGSPITNCLIAEFKPIGKSKKGAGSTKAANKNGTKTAVSEELLTDLGVLLVEALAENEKISKREFTQLINKTDMDKPTKLASVKAIMNKESVAQIADMAGATLDGADFVTVS